MKYFNNCHTLDELKKEYRRLVMIHHPDHGGDTATMQEINEEHDRVFEILKRQHNTTADAEHQTTETPEEFRNLITYLIQFPDLVVELCGSWLWISGNTMAHREDLKKVHCRWSSGKKMWYWHHKEDGSRYHRGKSTMDQIREKYGSQRFKGTQAAALDA